MTNVCVALLWIRIRLEARLSHFGMIEDSSQAREAETSLTLALTPNPVAPLRALFLRPAPVFS